MGSKLEESVSVDGVSDKVRDKRRDLLGWQGGRLQ